MVSVLPQSPAHSGEAQVTPAHSGKVKVYSGEAQVTPAHPGVMKVFRHTSGRYRCLLQFRGLSNVITLPSSLLRKEEVGKFPLSSHPNVLKYGMPSSVTMTPPSCKQTFYMYNV